MKFNKLNYYCEIITDYILAFLIILSCGSIYDNLTDVSLYISEFCMILLLIKVVAKAIIILKKKDYTGVKRVIIFSVLYAIYQSIYIIFHTCQNNVGINILTYIAKMLVAFCMFIYFYYLNDKKSKFITLLSYISNIMFYISIVSLFFYISGSILNIIKETNTVNITFGFTREIKSYCMLYFEPQYTIVLNKYIIRNCGIFAEAPMFIIPLLISFSYELMIKKERRKLNIVVLLLTIITTMSTTGIVIAIVLLIIELLRKIIKKYNVNKKKIINAIIVVGCIGIILCGFVISDKLKSPSFSIRLDDYIASFRAWLDNPILGNGYQNYEAVNKYISVEREAGGQSSSLSNLLVEGGLWEIAIYIVPFYILLKKYIKDKNVNNIIFLAVLFLIFLTTIFTYSMMSIYIISYGWYKIIFDKKESNDENIHSNS